MKTLLVSSVGRVVSTALVLTLGIIAAPSAHANRPVFVEGNNAADGPIGTTAVEPGSGGDYDGDGRVGVDEDVDNPTDRVFGTITAALGGLNGGINQNGRITIITSGRFAELLTITASTGNVTIEAAPGVEADLDAVLAGSQNNDIRQDRPAIIIDAPSDRVVTLRNLVIRNWAIGIDIRGSSRVHIDDCRLENNRDHGIRVSDQARVSITRCQINGTGHRVGSLGDTEGGNQPDRPNPGNGITFQGDGNGVVANTTVTGSAGTGIVSSPTRVIRKSVLLFDNNTNRANP